MTTRKPYSSHGTGQFDRSDLAGMGENVVIEEGVLIFHPENIMLGSNVYIGHQTILKGYFQNQIEIGDDVWIGQACFIHGGGGIHIGEAVGIGPKVNILTSVHGDVERGRPIMDGILRFAPVCIERHCDIGIGATICPGVTVGEGAQIGAGSVVTRNVDAFSVSAGVPAVHLRWRAE